MSSMNQRNSRNFGRVSRLLSGSSLAVLMLSGLASPAQAEDRHWDANGTSVGTGGTGIWDLGNLNWSPSADGVSGPYDRPWSNAAFDNAVFGGTAGVVTLGSTINVRNLTFNTAGYTLTGGQLTLGGASPAITTNTSAGGVTAIESVIAGAAGLAKAGAGSLQLSGVNTFTGDVTILGGRIYASSDAALGAASNSILTAAGQSVWLGIEGSNTARSVIIGDGGALTVTGAGVGSALISGNGNVNVAASNNNATIVRLTNDNNSYTGTTTFNACNGVCTAYFSSVRNIGEASSLGAATAENSTIIFNQSSQYSDNVIYIGQGDSSNRSWDINGAAGVIRNQGTGTLSISGDIDVSGGGSFVSETADIELLGVLSGGDYGFTALADRSVTVGGAANTFSGQASIAGLVRAAVLADAGIVSSLGVGPDIALNAGTLSYTGAGASSDRLWTISGAGGILNDGAGALNLTGGAVFAPGNPVDSLTLGGSHAGVNTYSGVISGAGDLIGNGAGTWVLGGANDFVGSVTVSSGTLQAGGASAFGAATGFIVNGGTLDLGGYDLLAPSLTGSGGSVALGAASLTVDVKDAQTYAGAITGSGGLRKIGGGALTLSGANSYTGATTIAGGKLVLDFAGGGPVSDIISASSSLVLSGGALEILGAAGATNNQSFDGLTVSAGSNTVRAINGGAGVVNLDLGAISRTGGLINFVLPGGGAITTSNADGVLGGWATVNGSDYAKVVNGGVIAFEASDYVNKDDAADWMSGDIVSDAANAANTPFMGTVNGDVQLGGLRYTAAANSTVTIGAGNTLGIDGAIIVAPSTLGTNQRLAGGFLTGGAGGGAFGVQQNGAGTFTIDSTIVDNGGTSFVKSGGGTVRLNGANSYGGGTVLSGGRLEVTRLGNGGETSSIGASGADSANLVLESGTLAYAGGSDVVTDRGFTLVNGGIERAIDIASGRSVEFTGQVTSPDDAGLTKVGSGTLILSNGANDYVGGTTISGGVLSVGTLTNGGLASGIGASSSASSNLVIRAGGALRYTGASATTDRGFTIDGIAGGGIDVANGGTTLTFEGAVIGLGSAPFRKDGAGTLVLSGANTYTGVTNINGGTLRAGSTQAFGAANLVNLANVAGAALDLDGFDNKVGGLSGGGASGGTVLLGDAMLTIGGSNATFGGGISGSGGIIKDNTSTQTLVGCNNDYTGATRIIRGTLSVDCLADGGQASGIGAASADAGNLVLRDSGILRYTGGTQTTDRGFTLENAWSYIDVSNAATTLDFTGIVEGAGHLAKRGGGTLVLSGANTFSGAVAVEAGTLRAGSSGAFDQGAHYLQMSNVAGAVFDLNDHDASFRYLLDGGAVGGNIDLGSGALTIANGGSYAGAIYAGAITGAGNLIKNGGSYQRLTGCNSDYTGSTTINAGVLEVVCLTDGGLGSSMGASSAAASSLILNGGTLRYAGTGGSTDRQFTLGTANGSALEASGTGAIHFTSTGPLAFSNPNTAQRLTLRGISSDNNILAALITDNGTGMTSLTKTESGTWILTNPASTYTGVTTISGGVLGVDKLADGGMASSIGASSSAASNLVIGSGSTLRYTGAGDTTNRLFTLSAGTSFIESSGAGAIVFTDTGPVTLAGANQARTIALGGSNTGANTLAGTIGDAGTGVTTLAKNDSGNWILTGDNTYSGNTVINDGNLIIGNGGTTGNAGTGNVLVTAATSTLSFNRSDTFNFTGAISGPGSIAQIGSGTTVLTATNSIGAAWVDDGTLQVDGVLRTSTLAMNGDGALAVNGEAEGATAGSILSLTSDGGASAITVNAGGVLRANGDLGGGDDVFILTGLLDTGAGLLSLGGGDDVFVLNDGGAITGAGLDGGAGTDRLVVDNALSRILDGASVAGFESLLKQNSGALTLTGDHSYSDGATIAAGTLRIGDGGVSGTLSGDIANNGALEFNRSGTLTIAGEISGAGSVEQMGSGTTVLTADNAYTGGTTISAGALQLGDGGAGGSIIGDVTNNGSLIFNRADSIGFDGLISGAGSLAKSGSGVVRLTADNSYSGATTVNAGVLLINGDQSAATGLTSVTSGATLGGVGVIGGDVSIGAGGVLTAGDYGVGTLSIAGGLTLDSGSILNMEFGQAGVVGGGLNDLIEVGGDLALDGATLNVTVPTGGVFGPGIYRVFNYNGDLLNDDLSLGGTPGGSDVTVQTAIAGQVNLVNSAGLSLSFWDGDGGPKFNDAVNGGDGVWHLGGTDKNWTGADGAINAAYADGSFAILAGTGGTVTIDNASGQVTASGMQFASDGYLVIGDALSLVGPTSLIQVGDSSVAGAGFTATIGADLSGSAQLVKTDAGTLVLSGVNSYTGGTLINGGAVRISDDVNLGDASGGIGLDGGTLNTTADIVSARDVVLTGAGALLTDAGTMFELAGAITGAGALIKSGDGALLLTNDASHSGGTTISAGTLQIGDGGATGSLIGDVLNDGTLIFNRSDATGFAGAIIGRGDLVQTGGGVLRLTGDSGYSGATRIERSELRLENGGSVNSGATTLGGQGATLTVAGAGSSLTTTELILGDSTGGAVSLSIEDGGRVIATGASQVTLGGGVAAGSPGHVVTANVSGANSLWDVGGAIAVGHDAAASASVTVADGGTVRSSGLSIGPALQSMTKASDVTISGDGSSWLADGSLQVNRGMLSVLDGGRLEAATGAISAASLGQSGQGSVLISGLGSEVAISGDLDISGAGRHAVVTVSDSGALNVGGALTLAGVADGGGVLNIGAAAGDIAAGAGAVQVADILFGPGSGSINFNHTEAAYDFASAMSGAGAINQLAGVTLLSEDSSAFSGLVSVTGGALYVNNALGGDVTVSTGGALGGVGIIGGDVSVADGSINPGDLGSAPGTLAISGDLNLAATSTINVNFGQANAVGGSFNDLMEVSGDLTLAGTLNVQTAAGGSFDPGIYRVINYGGVLTDNGLTIGAIPSPDFYVQTSVDKQVNLVNTAGMQFRYWDGVGVKNDGVIDGGDGLWQNSTGNDNWVDDGSIPNAQFADAAFAVFMGAAGTVTVDHGLGDVQVAGMQFLTDGYLIEGDAITLAGSDATIRVGDGTAAGAGVSATIASELTGAAQLVKSDLGSLVLSGVNSYTGGTAVNGGALVISSDANLGDAAGGLTFDGGALRTTADIETGRTVGLVGEGALLTDVGTALRLSGLVSGAGGLVKEGEGLLVLSGANSYAGETNVTAGTLLVNGDQSAATGLTSVGHGATLGGIGTIGGNVTVADGATLDPGGVGGAPGALTIGGSLSLASGSTLAMQFGEANAVGGALNDLIEVGGDLTLDGVLNVTVPEGGAFGPGVYRVINYGGALTNNGLDLGAMPTGSASTVQTSIAGQVNLVNTDGRQLNFWDGDGGPKFDNLVNGGDGVWQNSVGNDNWTDADGAVNAAYADDAMAIFAGTGGAVTIDNSLGDVRASGLQFAADGYEIGGEALTLVEPRSFIRVGDGSTAGAAFVATISADIIGDAQLVKTDGGTLVLSGDNRYTGGTAIEDGTVAISADVNLGDTAGGVTLNGGALRTTADLESDRTISFAGDGVLVTDQGTTFTLNGLFSGAGSLTKDGAGTLLITGNSAGYMSATTVAGGTLSVSGVLGGHVRVSEAGRLEGVGRVGAVTNAGVVAPGQNGIGTLTISGDYVGSGGALEIEAMLGGDDSSADRLVVAGSTSGRTEVDVINRDGLGAQTVEGVKIIDVAGASNGKFVLNGDYEFHGEQAVIAGAYGYRLYQGGVSTPTDGDWYLRSSLLNPEDPSGPDEPNPPLYQPGVPIYEAYAANLQSLNGLSTLQQRVGNRSWSEGASPEGSGVWARLEGVHSRAKAAVSTSSAEQRVDSWKVQIGTDRVFAERGENERMVAGFTAYYGESSSHVRSIYGGGSLKTDGYGLGATLTWYGPQGFYADGQAQFSWYESDLNSDVLDALSRSNDGSGEAFSLEVGKKSPIGGKLSVTPQFQMAYSNVQFDRFADAAGAVVTADRGDSFKTRWGVSLDRESEWEGGRSHVYGLVNLSYEWLDGPRAQVSGTPIDYASERVWAEIGLGASVNWRKGMTFYGEVSGNSSVKDFGDSYVLRANAGLRMAF